jgi:hypothetical protein
MELELLIRYFLKVAPQPDSDAILRCFFKKKEFFWVDGICLNGDLGGFLGL